MLSALLKGLGVGAGLMYFYDPNQGRRRRNQIQDQFNSLIHQTTNQVTQFVEVGRRDLRNRTQGMLHEGRARLSHEVVPDSVLCERVRATMGHYVRNAHDLDVDVADGRVVVSGSAMMHEAPQLLNAISHVRGVKDVESRLNLRSDPNAMSAESEGGACCSQWPPGLRLLAASVGALFMTDCLVRRSPAAILRGTLGFGLFVRAMSNRPISELSDSIAAPPRMKSEPATARIR